MVLGEKLTSTDETVTGIDNIPAGFVLVQMLLHPSFSLDALLAERIYVPAVEGSEDSDMVAWNQLSTHEKDMRIAAKRAEHAQRIARTKALDVVTVTQHLQITAEIKSFLGTIYTALALFEFSANAEIKASTVFAALKNKLEVLGATVTKVVKPTIVVAPSQEATNNATDVSAELSGKISKLGKRKSRNAQKKERKARMAAEQRLSTTISNLVQPHGSAIAQASESQPSAQIAFNAGEYYFSVEYPSGDLPDFAGLSGSQLELLRITAGEKLIELAQFLMTQLQLKPKQFKKQLDAETKIERHVARCEVMYAKIRGNRHPQSDEKRPVRIVASDAHYAGISVICECGCGRYTLAKMHGIELGVPASTGINVIHSQNAASDSTLVGVSNQNGKLVEFDHSTVPTKEQIAQAKQAFRQHAKQYPLHTIAVVVRGKETQRDQLEAIANNIRTSFPKRNELRYPKNNTPSSV